MCVVVAVAGNGVGFLLFLAVFFEAGETLLSSSTPIYMEEENGKT
jgi:hypothetical protein